MRHHPPAFGDLVVGVKFATQLPEVLTRVIEIHDLGGAGKLLCADIPDPVGAIAHDHLVVESSSRTGRPSASRVV